MRTHDTPDVICDHDVHKVHTAVILNQIYARNNKTRNALHESGNLKYLVVLLVSSRSIINKFRRIKPFALLFLFGEKLLSNPLRIKTFEM